MDVVGRGHQRVAERAGTNSSTEAESAGMAVYAHELSHNLSIPDNYNNPFTATLRSGPRAACGT